MQWPQQQPTGSTPPPPPLAPQPQGQQQQLLQQQQQLVQLQQLQQQLLQQQQQQQQQNQQQQQLQQMLQQLGQSQQLGLPQQPQQLQLQQQLLLQQQQQAQFQQLQQQLQQLQLQQQAAIQQTGQPPPPPPPPPPGSGQTSPPPSFVQMQQSQQMQPPPPPGAPLGYGLNGVGMGDLGGMGAPFPTDGDSLAEMARDPKGSRQLQLELPRWSAQQLKRASEELEPHLYELSKHTFGNYAVSKLATLPPMHPALARAMRGRVVELLQHPQGSRVVQAAMSALPASDTLALVHEIDGHILECSLDTHGSFGVCVSFRHTHAPFILAQLARHISALSTQQHGCRVVQSVLQAAAAAGMDLHAPIQALIDGELLYLAAHP